MQMKCKFQAFLTTSVIKCDLVRLFLKACEQELLQTEIHI